MGTNAQAANVTMQIGEVAKRTSLTVDAVRFYEKRKLLPKPDRSEGRFRLYREDSIERLRFIRQMQGLGFSLREIRDLIDLRARRVESCASVRKLLRAKLNDIRSKMHELRQLDSELVVDLRKCEKELKRRMQHPTNACPVLEESEGRR